MVRVPSREPVQGAFNHIGHRLSATSGHHLHRHLLRDEVGHCGRDGQEKCRFPVHHRPLEPDPRQAVLADRLPGLSDRGLVVERGMG
eukprot:5267906-Amphidinium_carterae.1